MKSIMFGVTLAVGSVISIAARADVDWKWDESRHVAAVPQTADAEVSGLSLPLTARASDEGFLSSFCYWWTESAAFRLSGGAPGFMVIVR